MNIIDLSKLTEIFGEDCVKESLDTWYEANSNELTLIKDELDYRIDMSLLFPTSNRRQAYKQFAHFCKHRIIIQKEIQNYGQQTIRTSKKIIN